MRNIVALLVLVLGLSACMAEEEAAIDGRWIGTITAEEREELRIEGQLPGDQFLVIFEPDAVHLNDTVRPAEYLPNRGRTLVHFKDENRALTVFHTEDNADLIRLSAVSYYKNKVLIFELRRPTN